MVIWVDNVFRQFNFDFFVFLAMIQSILEESDEKFLIKKGLKNCYIFG